MLENQLTQLSFHKNEIKIYLALFELGKCKAGDIIEHTKLHRNLVYTALKELIKRELVTKTIKQGVAEFVANDPKHLIDEMEIKKQLARSVAEELKKKQGESPREVAVYEGVESIKKFKERTWQLPPGSEIDIISASSLNVVPELEDYWRDYHKKRSRKGISAKFLFDQSTEKSAVTFRKNLPHTEVRNLPFAANLPIWFEMFGDYLEIGLPAENPLMFSIKSKEAVAGFKGFFNYFWNLETQVLKGGEALRDLWLKGVDCKEMRWIGAKGYFIDHFPEMFKEIKAKADKTPGVIWKNVVDPSMKDHTLTKLPYVKTKFHLSPNKNPTVVWLFGDTVLVTNWTEHEPIIFQSTNKYLVQSYNTYFEELWNIKT